MSKEQLDITARFIRQGKDIKEMKQVNEKADEIRRRWTCDDEDIRE